MSKDDCSHRFRGGGTFLSCSFPALIRSDCYHKKASKTAILSMHKAGLLRPMQKMTRLKPIWRIRYTQGAAIII